MSCHPNEVEDLEEVEIDQRALVNILSRYPGAFDILRELIQNADDADATNAEVHFLTEEAQESQSASIPDLNTIKVRKWMIKNNGGGFKEKDWERLGKIASGNDNSSKVGAFGVGFYSVLSKSDQPLVTSNGKSLQFERGKDGKLRKRFVSCSTDSWTSVELKLRDEEQLPMLADLTKFLVSSVAFLANIKAISVHLDSQCLLHIRKEVRSAEAVEIPSHLKPTTPLKSLTVESIERIVQRIVIDAEECVFTSSPTSVSPVIDPDALVERHGRSERRSMRISRNVDAIKEDNAITHNLYKARTRVDLDEHSEMKKGVESIMKSLPSSFECKAVYFNCEQSLAGVDNSQSPKAQKLAHLFCGSQGIFPGDDRHVARGRLFIGQSTNQTTGIGVHISAHFLPTMERGTIDLANGHVKAWNKEVLHVGGFLSRIIYEEDMHIAAKAKRDRAKELGLCTMDRFAFGTTVPHSGVSQILQQAFFSCCHEPRSPFPVVSDVGISCLSVSDFRITKSLLFLEKYRILHEEVESRQRSEIISRYKIPQFKLADIVREFECGVAEDMMGAFFTWWEDTNLRLSYSSLNSMNGNWMNVRKNFCQEFATRSVLRSNRGVKVEFKNIKHYTFFPLPDDLSPPDTIHVDPTWGVSSRATVECFGWTQLPLLYWLKYACSQAQQPASGVDSSRDSDVGYRILRTLVQFALADRLSQQQWDQAAELTKNLKCIPTNTGREVPANSYFEEYAVCGGLPIVREAEFLNIQPTLVPFAGTLEYRSVDPRHVREVLFAIRIRARMDWGEMIKQLETIASAESNSRLLYLTIIFGGRGMLMAQQLIDLTGKRIFYSEKHGHASAPELLLPSDDVGNLGLPVLALPQNAMASLQSAADRFGTFTVEALIGFLGMKKHPPLDKIIAQAASDNVDIRRSALHYLLTNLEKHYKAYKSDDFSDVAFIPTKSGSLARPNEVFASPVWGELGFKQVSDDLRRDYSRLGVKEGPSVDTIIEHFKNPRRTLPDINTATIWFKHLFVHGELPIPKLREQLSVIRFVPVKNPESTSPEPSIQYICPKDCFIPSAETKSYHREIFTFVDFGQAGNSFLESCCAKKSPNASDIVGKILQDPHKYLKALGNISRYREDLRTIASQLDSVSEDDKQAMTKIPMFLAERNGQIVDELLTADKVFIRDWVGHEFGSRVFVPPPNDGLEKMYRKMGSAFLGTCVRHVVTIGSKMECEPQFSREQVILRIKSFMKQREESLKTGVSFDDADPANNLEVAVCESLAWEKTFVQPYGYLVDSAAAANGRTKSMKKKAGFKCHEDNKSYTLWLVKNPDEAEDDHNELRRDIGLALCHVLLKTYSPDDVLLLASLFAMEDEKVQRYYPAESKLARDTKEESKDTPKVEIQLPLLPFIPKRFGKPGVRTVRTVGKQVISAEDDAERAVLSLDSALDNEAVGSAARVRLQSSSGKKHNYCKKAHAIRLKERKELKDETTQIAFFLARDAKCQQPPLFALGEFAELISKLASVFDIKDPSASCFIFWKDTDDDLMAFNRDQKYILFNLAHYYKFFYNKGYERKKVIIDWYLIMAHEIAHNRTMEHDEYHGLLSADLAIQCLPALYKEYPDISWESAKQPQST